MGFPALPDAEARHRVVVGQVTTPISLEPPAGESSASSVHADAPPIGFVVVTRLPLRSPATQSEGAGHDSVWNPPGFAPSAATTFHADAGPVGFAELAMFPSSSAAMQRLAVGHETASKT